jgi:hypothetical protein
MWTSQFLNRFSLASRFLINRLVITLAVRRETTIDSVARAWTGDDEIAPLA